jgi:hypothetical protein
MAAACDEFFGSITEEGKFEYENDFCHGRGRFRDGTKEPFARSIRLVTSEEIEAEDLLYRDRKRR